MDSEILDEIVKPKPTVNKIILQTILKFSVFEFIFLVIQHQLRKPALQYINYGDVKLSVFIIFVVLLLIFLFYFRKKIKHNITYWNSLFVSGSVAILSVLFGHIYLFALDKIAHRNFDFTGSLHAFLSFIALILFVCLILSAFFHKSKYTVKK